MRWIKLLYPGLGIKRWLLLLTLGFLILLGASFALIMGLPGLTSFVRWIVTEILQLTGDGRGNLIATAIVGLVIMVFAGISLVKSLLRDLAPKNESNTMVDAIYQVRYLRRGPRIVVIGGGTGLAAMLRGLKRFTSNITAVVTVADDGGSSGKLRGDFGMPPPGDIRNCLVALADTEPLLECLFQHRFQGGDGLNGHSFGNLFLAAMSQMLGFQQAVKESGKVLAVRGKVLPVTAENVALMATCNDGKEIWGESKIGKADTQIKRLKLVPDDIRALPEVLEDIAAADAVIVGPGSLYTSLLPNLLVNGIVDAMKDSAALKLYVCNIMTQKGETKSYSAADHLQSIYDHVGTRLFDYIVVNSQGIPDELQQRYAQEGAEPVKIDWERLRQLRVKVLATNLLQPGHVARHDPDALARALLARIAAETKRPRRLLDLMLLESQLKKIPAEGGQIDCDA